MLGGQGKIPGYTSSVDSIVDRATYSEPVDKDVYVLRGVTDLEEILHILQ